MSQRSDDLYLVDLIESAEALDRLLRDHELVSFAADDTLRSAVLWKLYIVSEASTRLSSDSRERVASIPWHELRGFRNRLAHGYFTLSWERIWAIAKYNVPVLKAQAEEVLARDFPHVFQQLLERRSLSPDTSVRLD